MSILYGDARSPMVPDSSVQCVVTSPPYFGLRSYGKSDLEIGRGTMEEYINDIVTVGECVWNALTDDGTWWLNIGDTASGSGGAGGDFMSNQSKENMPKYRQGSTSVPKGQWCLVPQRVAIALQEFGWMIRSVITWDKGRLRPESVKHTRRPGISSETILMLTKQSTYKFNSEQLSSANYSQSWNGDRGNVWHFPPARGKRQHMAPFPEDLPRRCILLSTDEGDTVMDPFSGSGTTVRVAESLGRKGIGIDIYSFESGLAGRH